VGGRCGRQDLAIVGHRLHANEDPLAIGVASGGPLRGPEDHRLSVRRELLETLGVLSSGLLVRRSNDGVTKEATYLREVLGGLGCGGESGSQAGSGREDAGCSHRFGPRNRGAGMEDLQRDAKAEGGLAGEPEEGTCLVERGQHRRDGEGAGGDRTGGLAQLGKVAVGDVHRAGQGDA
jgi:hypothetical protein